jgi:uncharacterized membrane protein
MVHFKKSKKTRNMKFDLFVILQQTLQQWQYLFYISIGVVTVPYITFLIYGSVEEQPWNRPKKTLNETTCVTHL